MLIQFQPAKPAVVAQARQVLSALEERQPDQAVDYFVSRLAVAPEGPHSLPSKWALQVRHGDNREDHYRVAMQAVVNGLQGPAGAVLAYLGQQAQQPSTVRDTLELIQRVGTPQEAAVADLALYDYGLSEKQSRQAESQALEACVRGATVNDVRAMQSWLPGPEARRLAADDYSAYSDF